VLNLGYISIISKANASEKKARRFSNIKLEDVPKIFRIRTLHQLGLLKVIAL
jgi:hypothetical protein